MVQSYVLHWSPYKQHALKGQKLLAQGIALGYHVRKLGALLLYPGRCPGLRASAPSGRADCIHCLGLRASVPSGRVGQNLRNFGGAKLRITETSVKSPLEKVENRIFCLCNLIIKSRFS